MNNKITCKKCGTEIGGELFCNNCSDEILMLYLIEKKIHFAIEQDFNLLPGTVLYWYNQCKLKNTIDLEYLQYVKQIHQEREKEKELALQEDVIKLIEIGIEEETPIEPTIITKNNLIYYFKEYLNGSLYDFKFFLIFTYFITWLLITTCQLIDLATDFLLVSIFPYICVLVWLITLYQLFNNKDKFMGNIDFKILFYLTLFPPTFFIIFICSTIFINYILITPFIVIPLVYIINSLIKKH